MAVARAAPVLPRSPGAIAHGAAFITLERTTATLKSATVQSAATWNSGNRGRRRLTSRTNAEQ